MVVVPKHRNYGFFCNPENIDPEWDEGVDVALAACRRALDRYGVINLHPDGYASAQLQSPLICDPGDTSRPWRPLLPQIHYYSYDLEETPGHWAERRRERDRRKGLPAEPSPVEPPPSPPPRPPLILRTNGGVWVVTSPPQPLPQPTVTFAPGPARARKKPPAPPEPEEPPLPEIAAPTLESALREFYRLYEGQGFSSRTKALYRSTVLRFLPGYQFPAHLR